MNDLLSETALTMSQAAATLPRRRSDRPIHASTISRWAHPGLRGVRLETVHVGGTVCTSREALGRFFAALAVQRRAQKASAGG